MIARLSALSAAALVSLSTGPVTAQYRYVPNYQAPTSPGVANYVAPVSPGVMNYRAPVAPGVANYVAPTSPGIANYVAPISPGVGYYVAPTGGVPPRHSWAGSYTSPTTTSTSRYSPSDSLLAEGMLFGNNPAIPNRPANDIRVVLPAEDAKVTLNGTDMTGTGRFRHLAVDGVHHGAKNEYTLTATWTKDGKPVTKTQVVHLDGTGHALADFR